MKLQCKGVMGHNLVFRYCYLWPGYVGSSPNSISLLNNSFSNYRTPNSLGVIDLCS